MTPDSPFAPAFSRQSFFETQSGREALRLLDDGLGAREPFLLLTGAPGVGKTALANEAVARWGSRVTAAFLAYSALTGGEFLEEILRRLGTEPPEGASRSKLVACVERALAEITGRGQVAVVVVDDAHDLSPGLLEELRLLVNAAQQVGRPLEVLLIGLPVLDTRFDAPELAALRQRISVKARLEPLSAAETKHYLHHRVSAAGGDGPGLFSRKASREIAARTAGVPRQVNALAAEALRVARAWGDQTVGPEHLQTAAATLGGFVSIVEGAAENGGEEPAPVSAPAPEPRIVPAPAPRAVAPPRIVPAPTPRTAAAPPPEAAPPPRIETAARSASTPSADIAPQTPAPDAMRPDTPTPPSTHDSREWVARFIGDKGPLQLSSRARVESIAAMVAFEENGGEPPDAPGPAPRPRRRQPPSRPRSRSRSKPNGRPQVAIGAALGAIVVVAAVAMMMRANALSHRHVGQIIRVAAAAPTTKHSTRRPTSAPAKRPASVPAVTAPPAVDAVPTPESEMPIEDATPRSRQPFTIDAGEFPDLASALDQRERLQGLTGFKGWVVPGSVGGAYRVVLGAYRSEERAASAANMLMNSKTLDGVTVVPLPPRSVRQ